MAEFQGQSKLSLYIADETLWDLLTMTVVTMKPANKIFLFFLNFYFQTCHWKLYTFKKVICYCINITMYE